MSVYFILFFPTFLVLGSEGSVGHFMDFVGLLLKRGEGKKGEVRDNHGLQPPKSKFSGYVASNVQL